MLRTLFYKPKGPYENDEAFQQYLWECLQHDTLASVPAEEGGGPDGEVTLQFSVNRVGTLGNALVFRGKIPNGGPALIAFENNIPTLIRITTTQKK